MATNIITITREIHRNAVVIDPLTEFPDAVGTIASHHERQVIRRSHYDDNCDGPSSYVRGLKQIDAAIGILKMARRDLQAMAKHVCRYDEDDYCMFCGKDGRA